MKITKLPNEFQRALPVMKKITDAGFEAYFVGGSVRDVLLGQPIHDVDIATSAFPAEIKAIFKKTIDVGIQHGTVLVLAEGGQYEVTTFRTESTYQDFRRPDHVEFVRSLEEDLKRRDFTINAFALREDGQVIDLFDGLQDLTDHTLRAVGVPQERFHEDALRMMRGLRFISQLGFSFEKRTFEAILDNHALLEKISVERINVEFVKLLLGRHRNRGLKLLVETECYEYCPGLRKNGEGLLRMADLPEKAISSEVQAWALLADQIELAEKDIRQFMREWKTSNELMKSTQRVFSVLQVRKERELTPFELYRSGIDAAVLAEELLPYFYLDHDEEAVRMAYHQLPIHQLTDLAVNGHDLMKFMDRKPGKWLKNALDYLEREVVEGRLINQKDQLLAVVKEIC